MNDHEGVTTMLVFHGGLTYLHIRGRLWLDRTSWASFAEWVSAGRDPGAIIWSHQAGGWA